MKTFMSLYILLSPAKNLFKAVLKLVFKSLFAHPRALASYLVASVAKQYILLLSAGRQGLLIVLILP